MLGHALSQCPQPLRRRLTISELQSAPNSVHTLIPHQPDTSRARDALILDLKEKGLTQTAIAQAVGLTQGQVSRILNKYDDTTRLAKARAHRLALGAVESLNRASKVAETQGKHGPQVALLQVAGVIKGDESGGARVQIVIGMPGSPAGPSVNQDVFDAALSLVPRNEIAE